MQKVKIEKEVKTLLNEVNIIIENTIKKVNYELINMYWNIGKMITEYKNKNNSKYGDFIIEKFISELTIKYGKGFNKTNIKSSINLYKNFKKSPPADFFKNITWSHYREIINFSNRDQILYYLNETEKKYLTKLELRNYIKSKGYERTIINQKSKLDNIVEKTLKDPVILNIENKKRSEKELEEEIIKNITIFKKEIGNEIMFYDRQYKININGLIHKVDLVFFDYETNTFILIDLKINKVSNRDIMQMKLYIEYFKKDKNEKVFNIVGLILCETKDLRVVNNKDIYQIRYLNEIPKEKELTKIINKNKIILIKTEKIRIKNY